MMHSWYNLDRLHSHHCKDQSDFISKLNNITEDCGFTNSDRGHGHGPGCEDGKGGYHRRSISIFCKPSSERQGKCGNCGA